MTSIEILGRSNRFNSIEDIIANMDLVAEVLRDDVARVLRKEGIVSTSFDDYYSRAVQVLVRNLKKKRHLDGIQRLLSCTDIELGLKTILSKLRGHTHCEMLTNRKNSVAYWQKKRKNEIEVMDTTHDPLELLIRDEEAKAIKLKNGKEKEIENFKKMVKNGEIRAKKTGTAHAQLFFKL